MDFDSLSLAVSTLLKNRLKPGCLPQLPAKYRPTSLTEAYDLQEALNVAITKAGLGQVVGHKVGCTSKVMQQYMGISHPCSGSIFETTLHKGPLFQSSKLYNSVGVECEIAVRLGEDFPITKEPYTKSSVYGRVESCMGAIEIVDNRYENFRSFDLETLVADDFFHAGCVLGAEVNSWKDDDLAEATGRLVVNDVEVGNGLGADIMGHPFEALAWLANHKVSRGSFLRSGEIVLLGSVVQTQWLSPGDKVVIEFDQFGEVVAEFFM